jgi:hypothetical protein
MSKNNIHKISLIFVFCIFAAATTDEGSSSSSSSYSSSSSSSPYSNVNAALNECAAELRADTNRGKYDHLSDSGMYRAMERDQESCMARYGHYPNN